VTLVNTSRTRQHETILQGGAFGEHQFQGAEINGKPLRFSSRHLCVELPPGAMGTITLRMKRYQYAPTYEFPADLRPRAVSAK
jgi:hypothetical protein